MRLHDRLLETSALAFDDAGRLFTINDGEAILYELDTLSGAITSERRLLAAFPPGADWEALAVRGGIAYVGDFGNNANGNRADLRVLRFDLGGDPMALPPVDTIAFAYADQLDRSPTAPNATDFDCEAFVVEADSIYLFTKEWRRQGTAVYALPNAPGVHVAAPRGRLDSLGLVTDAHFRSEDSTLVLSGYTAVLQPLVLLLADFEGRSFFGGARRRVLFDLGLRQVEGAATLDGRRYFLSNERFRRSVIDVPQGLSVVPLGGLLDELRGASTSASPGGRLSPKRGLRVRPNPTSGRAWVEGLDGAEAVRLYDGAGRLLRTWTASAAASGIDLSAWPPGTYWLHADPRSEVAVVLE